MVEERSTTWGGAVKENVLWFIFAILLAAGSSYLNSKTTTIQIRSDLNNLESRVTDVENETLKNRTEVIEVREDLIRLEGKINRLLKAQGIVLQERPIQDNEPN